MDRFWDAWEKSTVVSGTLAMGLMVIVGYLAVSGQDIPDTISLAFVSVIAWFFGAKGRDATRRAVEAALRSNDVKPRST